MSDVASRLREALGERVRTDPEHCARHRRDAWVLNELRDLEGRPPPAPLAVVTPASTAEVAETLRICRDARVPVVPFGGGSGVCGGVQTTADVVVLSSAALVGAVALDEDDLLASFRAGTGGLDAEMHVQKAGLTLGHWPQSIALSTVGGWVATRASGQYSTAYGSIEDLVFALEAVLPDGSVLRTRATPRAAAGPDLRQLFLGSEGTLGVITEVTFSLRPLPASRQHQAFHFADLGAGLDPLRRALRAGHRPPVARLYDAIESKRNFAASCPDGRALLILIHEGGAAAGVSAEAEGVAQLCREAGGLPADPSSVDHWLEHRNQVPGFRGFLEKGIILDTIEVACTWSRVADLYAGVLASLGEVGSLLSASAHSSHSYRSGTNLYFTFAARPSEREQMAEVYGECWRRTLAVATRLGAGIAHHHGIGRVRRAALGDELGASGVELLRTVKRGLDPDGLLNPGVLLPDP